jgi:flagellar biosynthesis anti-sigma factor FlgM
MMKITRKTDIARAYAPATEKTARQPQKQNAGKSDRADISATTRMLQDVVRSEEPFDAAKVASIKAAVSEGRYVVDTRRLGERLLAEIRAQRIKV